MEKNSIFDDEFFFFDAEILDDDDDAPVGTLLVRQSTDSTESTTNADVDTDTSLASEQADDAVQPMVEDAQAADSDTTAPVVDGVDTTVDVEQTAEAKTESDQDVKAPTTGHISLSDSFDRKSMDMSFDYAIELAPAPKTEPKKAKAPAKPKTTAPKKEYTEADIWGTASIGPKKKSEPVKEEPTEEVKPVATAKTKKSAPKATVAPETTPAPTEEKAVPVKKARKKAEQKPDANNVEINKTNEEENKVAKEAKEINEQILVEGEGKYHGKFVIKKTDKGHFVYKLFAYGNKCVAIGAQAYESLSGCKGGIASVQRIAATSPIENQTLKSYETLKFPKWEIYADKKGEFRLRLYASNGYLVATTNDGYLSVGAAKKGIESVAHAAEGAAIVRNDDLW